MSQEGVNISLREIYDTVQEIKSDVKDLSSVRNDVGKGVEAYDTAKRALELAKKHEDGLKWLWRTAAGALVVALIGFIFLSTQIGISNQLQKQMEVKIENQGGESK